MKLQIAGLVFGTNHPTDRVNWDDMVTDMVANPNHAIAMSLSYSLAVS